MKKKIIYKILCSCVILLVYACTQDISLSEGEGILKLGIRVDDAVKMVPIQLGRSTTRGAPKHHLKKVAKYISEIPKALSESMKECQMYHQNYI